MFTNHLEAYKKYQREVAKLLMEDANKSRDDADLEADLLAMIEFEKEFATIIVPEDDRRNNTRMYNKRRIADLAMLMPQIEFLRKAARLLDSTDDRIKTNYIMWRIVHSWVKVLDMRFDDIKQEMIANLREAFKELVADNDWMDSATKKVAIEKAEGMINHIGYPDFIKNDTDLDKHYERSLRSFRAINASILHTSKFYYHYTKKQYFKVTICSSTCDQPTHILIFYEKFCYGHKRRSFYVSQRCLINMNLRSAQLSSTRSIHLKRMPSVTFPAGILKPPFFSGMYPKMVNYGAIGAVIGHEITHGFDDQGSQFDKDGNLQNWWNPDSYKGFAKRKECIINQYSSYKVPNTDLTVNGKLTQGENIADNGGVKEAYRAYRKYVKQLGREEPRLPGLQHFSNDQIFFLSYAHVSCSFRFQTNLHGILNALQFWCGHKKDAAAVQQVLTDEHSPEIFRVIGVLSNLDEFSKAFRCASGTPLNPPKRCIVW
uniref:Peptidase M13 C-terminal domain-containing protein n=1 Tax=Parascaris equorum TaxID=6256 RepID=A0A914RKS8_PAREQ